MMAHPSMFAMFGLIAAAALAGTAAAGDPSTVDPEALSRTPWLTTAVYIDGHPETNVKDDYLGVVGLALWDTQRNRYEYFDTETGASKLAQGGGGYFFVTGDKSTHVIVPDIGGGAVARKIERLDDAEFTYTRIVPEKLIAGNRPVKIWVVHKPYRGPLKFQFTPRP
jgi:hypothetical protein